MRSEHKCGTSFIVIMLSSTSRWCLFRDALVMLGLIDGVSIISCKTCLDQLCRWLVTNVKWFLKIMNKHQDGVIAFYATNGAVSQ